MVSSAGADEELVERQNHALESLRDSLSVAPGGGTLGVAQVLNLLSASEVTDYLRQITAGLTSVIEVSRETREAHSIEFRLDEGAVEVFANGQWHELRPDSFFRLFLTGVRARSNPVWAAALASASGVVERAPIEMRPLLPGVSPIACRVYAVLKRFGELRRMIDPPGTGMIVTPALLWGIAQTISPLSPSVIGVGNAKVGLGILQGERIIRRVARVSSGLRYPLSLFDLDCKIESGAPRFLVPGGLEETGEAYDGLPLYRFARGGEPDA